MNFEPTTNLSILFIRCLILISLFLITFILYCIMFREKTLLFFMGLVVWIDLVLQVTVKITVLLVAEYNSEKLIEAVVTLQVIGNALELIFYIALVIAFVCICNKLSQKTGKYMFWHNGK